MWWLPDAWAHYCHHHNLFCWFNLMLFHCAVCLRSALSHVPSQAQHVLLVDESWIVKSWTNASWDWQWMADNGGNNVKQKLEKLTSPLHPNLSPPLTATLIFLGELRVPLSSPPFFALYFLPSTNTTPQFSSALLATPASSLLWSAVLPSCSPPLPHLSCYFPLKNKHGRLWFKQASLTSTHLSPHLNLVVSSLPLTFFSFFFFFLSLYVSSQIWKLQTSVFTEACISLTFLCDSIE